MTGNKGKTALVTGASSGLGFEAAAQLAEAGYARVIITARTPNKASATRVRLVERIGSDPFEELALDLNDSHSVHAAVDTLADRGGAIDAVILNAGLVAGAEVELTPENVEITVAASLTGHHRLTLDLIGRKLVAENARLVIAGSEAARGDVPMMGLTDVEAFADEHFGGDRMDAITTIARAEAPYEYKNMPHYAMTKLFVAWWAAALSRRLPEGMTVNAVSPGSAPDTSAMRNQPWPVRVVMIFLFRTLGRLLGLAAPLSKAARRYIDAIDYEPNVSGRFFASRPGKMTGQVVEQTQPHVTDFASQEAAWQAIVRLTGGATLASATEQAA